MLRRITKLLATKLEFSDLDLMFRETDRSHIRRTKNIRLIPDFANRKGGKLAYAEWAHVIGIFQTIIYQILDEKTDNHILDIGCGTGLLGISSEPFTYGSGTYTGIDVSKDDVDFCMQHYGAENYQFKHVDVANPTYAAHQDERLSPWPVESGSKDLVTALSVWTHLREEHAVYFFKEIARVLKPGGKALITFFYLDESYRTSLSRRSNEAGRFHETNQNAWIFEDNAYQSKDWFTPRWTKNPEDAIGIAEGGVDALIEASGLQLSRLYPGNWKEHPGVFFQDILIFEK